MTTSTHPTPLSTLPTCKDVFLQSCLSANVLTFGAYTLKSGRHANMRGPVQSPYFFNAGYFHTASLLAAISTAYAHTIISFLSSHPSVPKPDILFGPAYKGISLACSTLLELYRLDSQTWSPVSYSFNRKEVKDHGEGGAIVGASSKGKNVLVLDDVVTAGTAMRETMELVAREGGQVVGFVVALDRKERRPSTTGEKEEGFVDDESRSSALGQIRKEFGVLSASIVTLDNLIDVLEMRGEENERERLEEYRRKYLACD
ncbi:orotate phosphoribosyltransferase [Tothia fuscella]|uniref:Orotate phosphoribosyltransferase n=1 Tax=Tothia fuscella TaxID=1048955 RepID=A0A9P4NWJ3_9PEZI|nr:orotate phosphoribosyltransferase [Tothia fuscella]